MELVVILHQEVPADDDQDESDRGADAIKEVSAGGSRDEEVCEEQPGAEDDGADGPEPT